MALKEQTASSAVEEDGANPANSPAADAGAENAETNVVETKAEGAERPDAKETDPRAELLAAVRKAVDKKVEDPAGASSDPSGKKDGEGAEGADGKPADGKKPGEGDAKKPEGEETRFDKHPRFREMNEEIKALRPQAEQWGKVTKFMEVHDLTPKEVADGFVMMALLKNEPAKFVEAIQPYLQAAQRFVGEGPLPKDLADRVESGEISETAAKEIVALRAGKEHVEQVSTRDRERNEAHQAQEVAAARVSAVDHWVASKKSGPQADPDFAAIEGLVRDRARAIVIERAQAGNPPMTPAAAVEVVEEAYKQIKTATKPLRPAKPSVRHIPSGGSASTNAQPKPATLFDAAKQGLQRARAARA